MDVSELVQTLNEIFISAVRPVIPACWTWNCDRARQLGFQKQYHDIKPTWTVGNYFHTYPPTTYCHGQSRTKLNVKGGITMNTYQQAWAELGQAQVLFSYRV